MHKTMKYKEYAQSLNAKGNWITLAEYDNDYKPLCVKSVKIDGKKLKKTPITCLKMESLWR